jgi:hypothetical protein
MNELYACDPKAIRHTSELKLLLKSFGPFVGRYIAELPLFDSWRKSVLQQFSEFGELEQKRISLLIHKANQNATFYRPKKLNWNADRNWLSNVLESDVPKDRVFTDDGTDDTLKFNDMDLPANTGEHLLGNKDELLRACEILILISHEIYFIDAYLYFNKSNVRNVVEHFVDKLAEGKCTKVTFINIPKDLSEIDEIKSGADNFLRKMRGKYKNIKFKYLMLNNVGSDNKIHRRYLMSIKGAIDLDKGFQEEANKKSKVSVIPVNETIHTDLIKLYHENEHGMTIEFDI